MTFPLLRLPLLASIEVINRIDVKQLITLIQLSTRARILVKLSKVRIDLTVFESSIEFQKLAGHEMPQRLKFFGLSEKAPKDLAFKPPCSSKFASRIQYQVEANKKLMDDFVRFFKVCSVAFELESACSYTSLCYMEHAKGLGLKFTTARVCIGRSNETVYQSLLKICSNASQLVLWLDTDEAFSFNGFNEYRMQTFRYYTNNRDTKWFTTDYMCALVNCSVVSVSDHNWTDADINRFLRFWMTSDGRLQSVISKKRYWYVLIDSQVVMNGIDCREIGIQKFEIQRADGVKAEVECSNTTGFTFKVIDA